jgi:hypothetical protein
MSRANPVDLDRLEQDLTDNGKYPERAYAPKSAPPKTPAAYTPIQAIAHAITMLTWKEAEEMGAAIQGKIKDGSSTTLTGLTSAIQAWAGEWEAF